METLGTQESQGEIENTTLEKERLKFTFSFPEISLALEKINFVPDQKRALFLAKKQQVNLVYNTTSLENNPFTLPEIQTLLEGITVGGQKVSDEQQVLNQNESYLLLYEMVKTRKFALNQQVFCQFNDIVAREESLNWGAFRDGNVTIGGTEYKPPAFQELDTIFQAGIEYINKVENPFLQSLLIFLFGSLNQFFYDGNKRTSRLMMNGVLLNQGFPVLNVEAKNRLDFNTQMLRFYDQQNATDALLYFLEYYRQQNENMGFENTP